MKKQSDKNVIYYILLFVLLINAIVAIFPFFYMALMSLTQKDMLDLDFSNVTFSLKNYFKVIDGFNLLVNLRNSIIVTVSSCLLNAIICSMAAYAFAKKHFPLGIKYLQFI